MCVRDRAEEEGWSALEVCVIDRTCIRPCKSKKEMYFAIDSCLAEEKLRDNILQTSFVRFPVFSERAGF